MKATTRSALLLIVLFIVAPVGWSQAVSSLVSNTERIEKLRSQLSELKTLEARLQERIQALDIDLQPDNLQRAINQIGTLSADALREQRRRYLESEKARISEQLRIVTANVINLEKMIALGEIEIAKLKADAATAAQKAVDTAARIARRN